MPRIRPFLMFTGRAEEAMRFYVEAFPRSRVVAVERWGAEGSGAAGTIKHATFAIDGQEFRCIDSPPVHEFGFTPSVSFFVSCADAAEVDAVYAKLAEGGQVMMPLDRYPFNERYAWLSDRFGVSWQVGVEPAGK